MLTPYSEASEISRTSSICLEDILLISLNALGLRWKPGSHRQRLRLRITTKPEEELRLILSAERDASPFELIGDKICLEQEVIGMTRELEDDSAVIGYLRREGT